MNYRKPRPSYGTYAASSTHTTTSNNTQIPADTTWSFEDYISKYRSHAGHPVRILVSLFSGNGAALTISTLGLIAKQSPVWVLPLVTRNIINIITYPEQHTLHEFWINLGVALLFILQNIVSTWLYAYQFGKVNRSIERNLRGNLIVKLQQLSIRFHHETQSGRILSKVIRDVENVEVLLDQTYRSLPLIALDISIAVTVTAISSPEVLIFFAISVPLAVGAIYWFRKPIRQSNHEFRYQMEQTQAAVAEMIAMIPVTRAHGLQHIEIGHMRRQLKHIQDTGLRLDVINGLFGATSWVVFQIAQLCCLAFTSWLALQGTLHIGDVVLFQTYFTQIVGGISSLVNLYPILTKGLESVNSIGEILQDTDTESSDGKTTLPALQGAIDFDHVTFRYGSQYTRALNDFSLHIPAGQSVALVGESGSGKSTLLNLLIGFATPESGTVCIDHHDLTSLNLDDYRHHIAVVPQETILFAGSLRDNITYGLDNVTTEELLQVIHDVGLDDVINALPNGLDTQLGEHGNSLSGGQKQRIAIARALVRHPRIIIFDEATSALDSVSEQQVQAATERMMGQCTTILVAHRLSTIRNADRIIVMDHGSIAEEGTYDELMQQQGKFYTLRQLQE